MRSQILRYLTLSVLLVIVINQLACKFGSVIETVVVIVTPTEGEQQAGPVETKEQVATELPVETLISIEPTVTSIMEPTSTLEILAEKPIKELPVEIMDYYAGNPVSYTTIDDFDESWAQIGWYQYWRIEDSPTNFVIRAKANWASASNTANWNQSGCGFVFHITDEKNHYIAYLGLDGKVYFQRMYQGKGKVVGSSYFGKVGIPEGNAELMLMVYGDKIYFLVDGTQVYKGTDLIMTGKLKDGDLALTLVSGTNKDYGTRCQMTNIDLWDLGAPVGSP